MKFKLTFILLLVAFVSSAQYDYYDSQTQFGVGVGHNILSIVDDNIKPWELSMRLRINRNHTLQLYTPFLKKKDSFQSQEYPEVQLVNTSIKTKKSLYGLGMDYDYALYTYSSLDFIVGLRAELQIYKNRTELTNEHPSYNGYNSSLEYTNSKKEQTYYILSPNAGFRINMNIISIDAKLFLSMLSMRGDVESSVKTKRGQSSIIAKEWDDKLSNKFKLKPGIVVSISHYF